MQSLMLMWNKRNYNLFSLYIPIATRFARSNLSNKVGQLILLIHDSLCSSQPVQQSWTAYFLFDDNVYIHIET